MLIEWQTAGQTWSSQLISSFAYSSVDLMKDKLQRRTIYSRSIKTSCAKWRRSQTRPLSGWFGHHFWEPNLSFMGLLKVLGWLKSEHCDLASTIKKVRVIKWRRTICFDCGLWQREPFSVFYALMMISHKFAVLTSLEPIISTISMRPEPLNQCPLSFW